MSTSLIAGGAGFLGSHLCDLLISHGHRVIAVDNFVTGSPDNIAHLRDSPSFRVVEHDVTRPLTLDEPLDAVYHLASPADPDDFDQLSEEIMWVNSLGTRHLCDLAAAHDAKFLFTSTSEVYGDPLEHPQSEDYAGNVNPNGRRAPYDESKRFGEALVSARRRAAGLNARIVRAFNTYGPRMRPDDGRMAVRFIRQALDGEPLTIQGDGRQTRSLCYVSDLVEGMRRAMILPGTDGAVINLGSPAEHSIEDYARLILELTGSDAPIVYEPARPDDPRRRRPDIRRAREALDWAPAVSQREGLSHTIAWIREQRAVADAS